MRTTRRHRWKFWAGTAAHLAVCSRCGVGGLVKPTGGVIPANGAKCLPRPKT